MNGHATTPNGAARPSALVAAALGYASRGWPVVVLHYPTRTGANPVCSCPEGGECAHVGKHPRYDAGSLPHGAHSATTDTVTIQAWCSKWPTANIGIAVGLRSGLLALDIDPRNGGDETLEALVVELGPLPHTVEAITGGGGRHLLFRHPCGEVVGALGPGVDVLGTDGKQFVAEPSLHALGRRYCWELSSAPDVVAVAELPEAWKVRLLREGPASGIKGNREYRESGNQGSHPTDVDPAIPAIPAIPVTPVDPQWTEDRLINETLPTGRGQHDRCSMDFARGARLNIGYATPEAAAAMFERWWDRARPFCAEQDADSSWFKFVRGFDAARFPLGVKDLASMAYERVQHEPRPKAAAQLRTERMRLLVGMCCILQRTARGPFKLSCHQLGRLFNVNPSQAWEWLRGLERGGVLRCVERGLGGAKSRKAATFEYLGDDPLTGVRTSFVNPPREFPT